MSIDLLLGIAIGLVLPWLVLLTFNLAKCRQPVGREPALAELRRRNDIGDRQCAALEELVEVAKGMLDEQSVDPHAKWRENFK